MPQKDDAGFRSDRQGGQKHSLDDQMREFFQDHSVFERARLALVSVADDIFCVGFLAPHEFPLSTGRKTGATHAAQFGIFQRFDTRFAQCLCARFSDVLTERANRAVTIFRLPVRIAFPLPRCLGWIVCW